MREIIGVVGHEMSHIRNNDLSVMTLADTMTRFVQMLSYAALVLVGLNLIGLLGDEPPFSWWAILLLYLAPAITSVLQLALSRTREFDADLEGAMLTGDPLGLASALRRLDQGLAGSGRSYVPGAGAARSRAVVAADASKHRRTNSPPRRVEARRYHAAAGVERGAHGLARRLGSRRTAATLSLARRLVLIPAVQSRHSASIQVEWPKLGCF